nr:hypothetical protein [Tanacetum cinerariifolium]
MIYDLTYSNPPQETSVEILQAKGNLMKSIQTFLKKFNPISFRETSKVLSLAWEKFFEIQHAQPEDLHELVGKLLEDLQIISKELAEYINSLSWNCPTFCEDDDEFSIQYREYLQNSSNAITPNLPTEELDNSLSMGDEHLSTIPKMKSDEVVKSSVENLVPIPSESEGIFDDTCDVPFCDNSPPLDVLNDHFEIFSDFNNDCTSSDDDSFADTDYVEASPPDSELVSLEIITLSLRSPILLSLIQIILYPNSRLLAIIHQDELTSVVMEEPHAHVPNVLPTHPTLMMDLDFIPSNQSFGSDLEVSFPSKTKNKIFDLGIFFEV